MLVMLDSSSWDGSARQLVEMKDRTVTGRVFTRTTTFTLMSP